VSRYCTKPIKQAGMRTEQKSARLRQHRQQQRNKIVLPGRPGAERIGRPSPLGTLRNMFPACSRLTRYAVRCVVMSGTHSELCSGGNRACNVFATVDGSEPLSMIWCPFD
jgi:hypothetical protein